MMAYFIRSCGSPFNMFVLKSYFSISQFAARSSARLRLPASNAKAGNATAMVKMNAFTFFLLIESLSFQILLTGIRLRRVVLLELFLHIRETLSNLAESFFVESADI